MEDDFDVHLDEFDVEKQTELMYKDDTIWTAVFNADKNAIEILIEKDPDVIELRGAVGECPIHMLFIYGTNEHLMIAQELITRFPRIVTQIYNKSVSKRFDFRTDNDRLQILDLLWRKYSAYCDC